MRRKIGALAALLAALAVLSGCSGSDDGGGGSPSPVATNTQGAATVTRTRTATTTFNPTIPATSTRTATAANPTIPATSTATSSTPASTPTATVTSDGSTPTPSSGAAFSGVVLVRNDFQAASGDALGAPPAEYSDKPGTERFDRALSHASWNIEGPVERAGETNPDGSFGADGLPPGDYRLELSKTVNGNLLSVVVPFAVGDEGRATVVVEVAQGLVRWTNEYTDGGVDVRERSAPNGSRLVVRDGKISEISGGGRSYADADGDGTLEPGQCGPPGQFWLCRDDRACGEGRVCQCAGSCPGCEDCPASVCAPPQATPLYKCSSDNECDGTNESCVCVSSCPECDDCAASVCAATSCDPAQIAAIDANGPSRLILGQSGSMTATARLTDGWTIDVTHLVDWASSSETVATVDDWGTLTTVSPGTTGITAQLSDLASEPWDVEVVERPPLQKIFVQNISCYYPYGIPDVGPNTAPGRPFPDGSILPPDCRQVVRVGGVRYFLALGEFEDGYYEDITSQVTWELTPEGIGQMTGGEFKGLQPGDVEIRARLGDVVSDASTLKVVDQATVVALQIYPLASVARDGPVPSQPADQAIPCYDCGYAVTILSGDELPFQATAAYDTGEWEDVTTRVTWSSSNTTVGAISSGGVLSAAAAGETGITATLGETTSNGVNVRVVETATLVNLSIYQEGLDAVVEKGDQSFFRALGYYDVGFGRDVTDDATWKSSDETIGGFEAGGTFVGRSAGTVQVWAELDGVGSNRIPIEVFQTSSLGFCDDNNINRAEWSDAFNRVVLETDCGVYSHPDVASVRFTVTERERPVGLFDPCLDLYVYQGDRIVRTIREEGCGSPFLAPGADDYAEAKLRYQSLAFWDLKDDRGSPVPPGTYTIYGRFYLYYDPIIELDVLVQAPSGRIPCVENSCGNGCAYVHACGGTPPLICPTVCTLICECPAGWGITEEGDCEPCTEECCPRGAACLPGTPTCDPPPVCCPDGMACIPELPPCSDRCCPLGALCGPLDLPPCDCCPVGAQCIDLVPCEPEPPCCPKDAICILPLPVCPDDCCPPGVACTDDLIACEDLMCCRPDGSCLPNRPPCK